jgi:diguanylate cyclase (GGDEF)-like protein
MTKVMNKVINKVMTKATINDFSQRKYTLLCIDDESTNLKVLASIFKDYCQVIVSKNAAQGLNKALENIPDLILLDVLMPNENGFELITKLKSNDKTKHIPVIFITGLHSSDDEEKGLILGACDYIQKPFNHAIVRARVNSQLELARQRKLLAQFVNFDGLTELPNQKKWQTDSFQQWQIAMANQESIVMGIIDIDFFEKYNDNYGQQQGDITLKAIAQALNRIIFSSLGTIYRCGWQQFYFYLPTNNKNDIRSILVDCLESVTNLKIEHNSSTANNFASVSIGAIQVLANNSSSVEQVIDSANQQLVLAKQNMRNAVYFENHSLDND